MSIQGMYSTIRCPNSSTLVLPGHSDPGAARMICTLETIYCTHSTVLFASEARRSEHQRSAGSGVHLSPYGQPIQCDGIPYLDILDILASHYKWY